MRPRSSYSRSSYYCQALEPLVAAAVTSSAVSTLFRADRKVKLVFSGEQRKIRILYRGWGDAKAALEGQVFEVSLGAQGQEGRVRPMRSEGSEGV